LIVKVVLQNAGTVSQNLSISVWILLFIS
jgi:hypothetical protein